MSIKTNTETGSNKEGHTGRAHQHTGRATSTGVGWALTGIRFYVSASRAHHCWSPNIANLKDTKKKKKKKKKH